MGSEAHEEGEEVVATAIMRKVLARKQRRVPARGFVLVPAEQWVDRLDCGHELPSPVNDATARSIYTEVAGGVFRMCAWCKQLP
jgi:hypothetical protein